MDSSPKVFGDEMLLLISAGGLGGLGGGALAVPLQK